MKKLHRLISVIAFGAVLMLTMCGYTACNSAEYQWSQIKSDLTGLSVVVQTYDVDSNIIDQVVGRSVDISADDKFAIKDSEGNTTEKSSVVSITVGGQPITHVGSSLIMYEAGMTNVFEEYAKTVDVKNMDRSVPFVNKMVNDMINLTTGNADLILIRSQTGKPLATFVGNSVSHFATDIDKSTGLMVDGKFLFIYRCDYTIYPLKLLQPVQEN